MRLAILPFLLCISACATTPVTGERYLTGGASAERVSGDVFNLSADLNGYTAAAALKPVILQRARLLAEKNGYTGFDISRYAVRFYQPDNQFSAKAEVRFFRVPTEELPGSRYSLGSPSLAPLLREFSATDSKLFSKISNSRS